PRDQRGYVKRQHVVRLCRRPRDKAPAHLHQPWAGRHAMETDAKVVFGDFELGSDTEAGPIPDWRRNDHASCPINGGSHPIRLPRGGSPGVCACRRRTTISAAATKTPPTTPDSRNQRPWGNSSTIATAIATSDRPGMPMTFTGAKLIVIGGNCSRMTSSFY